MQKGTTIIESGLVNIFSKAVGNVLETMAMVKVVPGSPIIKSDHKVLGVVTGVIGLAGQNGSGMLCVSFQEKTILKIMSNMLMTEFTSINDEVVDAVGEITNIVCGDLKRQLSEISIMIGMSTPLVLCGQNMKLHERATRKTVVLPFETSAGGMALETNFEPIPDNKG